jgi:hypothetical protein
VARVASAARARGEKAGKAGSATGRHAVRPMTLERDGDRPRGRSPSRARRPHIGGIDARPEEYERRVTAFFDRALLGQ